MTLLPPGVKVHLALGYIDMRRDVLERLSDGYPVGRLDDLLPWNWTQLRAAA